MKALSVDGNLLSLCEYVRPTPGRPSTSTATALPRLAYQPAGVPTAAPHPTVSPCGHLSSRLTDLGHDHDRFVPLWVTKIRDMSAAGGPAGGVALFGAALGHPRSRGAGSNGRGPRGRGR